jgi:hypothetical protein
MSTVSSKTLIESQDIILNMVNNTSALNRPYTLVGIMKKKRNLDQKVANSIYKMKQKRENVSLGNRNVVMIRSLINEQ